MNDNIVSGIIGFVAGAIIVKYIVDKNFAKKADAIYDKGWVEAHQAVESVLDYANNNGLTPSDVKRIIRDEA